MLNIAVRPLFGLFKDGPHRICGSRRGEPCDPSTGEELDGAIVEELNASDTSTILELLHQHIQALSEL
jgi:hypothetical protein